MCLEKIIMINFITREILRRFHLRACLLTSDKGMMQRSRHQVERAALCNSKTFGARTRRLPSPFAYEPANKASNLSKTTSISTELSFAIKMPKPKALAQAALTSGSTFSSSMSSIKVDLHSFKKAIASVPMHPI